VVYKELPAVGRFQQRLSAVKIVLLRVGLAKAARFNRIEFHGLTGKMLIGPETEATPSV
jgi:hypothetical protein